MYTEQLLIRQEQLGLGHAIKNPLKATSRSGEYNVGMISLSSQSECIFARCTLPCAADSRLKQGKSRCTSIDEASSPLREDIGLAMRANGCRDRGQEYPITGEDTGCHLRKSFDLTGAQGRKTSCPLAAWEYEERDSMDCTFNT